MGKELPTANLPTADCQDFEQSTARQLPTALISTVGALVYDRVMDAWFEGFRCPSHLGPSGPPESKKGGKRREGGR